MLLEQKVFYIYFIVVGGVETSRAIIGWESN
jgi:hypothetical protein